MIGRYQLTLVLQGYFACCLINYDYSTISKGLYHLTISIMYGLAFRQSAIHLPAIPQSEFSHSLRLHTVTLKGEGVGYSCIT